MYLNCLILQFLYLNKKFLIINLLHSLNFNQVFINHLFFINFPFFFILTIKILLHLTFLRNFLHLKNELTFPKFYS